jgi:V-type H+-transporting ATPase subunit d
LFADFRTQLSTTDYGNFLANEPSPVSTSTIAEKATQILVDQFNFLRANAVEPLSKFFDYITYVLVDALRRPCADAGLYALGMPT